MFCEFLMKINNFLNIVFISVLFIIIFPNSVVSKDCDNFNLFNFGIKPFCELNDGNPVSCFGSLSGVRYAYIQCDKNYFQKENISQQILECKNNGEWSDELMTCSPECIEPPNELKLIEDNMKFPPWYVEFIRKVPKQGRVSRIPGMLFFEREIVTLKKLVGDFGFPSQFIGEYLIRIYNNETSFTDYDYAMQDIKCGYTNNWYELGSEYCIIVFRFNKYIKFDENRKPVCTDNIKFQNINKIRRNKRIPKYIGDCIVPRISDTKIELVCFKNNPNWNYQLNRNTTKTRIPTDCRNEPNFIITRCRIGYQYKKPPPTDNLSSCVSNIWFYEPDNGCDLICGEIDKNFVQFTTSRLFEGNEIDITSTPWHVGIFANHTIVSKTYEQICGGTIIHSNIVISAAHCFYDESNSRIYEAYNYLIGAGKNLREYNANEENNYYVGIKKIHVTENYQSTEILNDIAILILKDHLKFSSHIRPVCVDFTQYNDYNIKNGINGYITGWGFQTQNGDRSNKLLTANLSTITNDECKQLVGPNFKSQIIGDKFCATNKNNATACQGDSGGGFIVKKNIGLGDRYYLTGIINVGIDRRKICSNGFLTLFTNIQFYQNFINDIISEERNQFFY